MATPRIFIPLVAALCLTTLPATAQEPEPADTAEAEDAADDPLPLQPDRSIRIERDRGTWISVDVSPDGERIVFDYLGDLFVMPIEGGEATQLTSGMAFDAQPRFSPDGERIVFTSDRSGGQNVWIISVDGTDTVQVSKGGSNRAESPEWTPDGDYVIAGMGGFRYGDLPRLHIFHVEGGGGTKLIDEPERLKTLGPAFGADARWVWFARRFGDWQYNADLPQYQLAVFDRETGDVYGRSSRYGSGFRPTLSPDGQWLVYGTRHDQHTGLMLRDLETGEERWLAYPVQHDDQESRATLDVLPGMSFTPDSRHLVASYDGRIWKLPVDGGPAEEIPFNVSFDLDLGPKVFFDYPVSDSETFTVRQIRDARPPPTASASPSPRSTGSTSATPTGRTHGGSGPTACRSTSPHGRPTAAGSPSPHGRATRAISGASGPTAGAPSASPGWAGCTWSPRGRRTASGSWRCGAPPGNTGPARARSASGPPRTLSGSPATAVRPPSSRRPSPAAPPISVPMTPTGSTSTRAARPTRWSPSGGTARTRRST